jgi:hypothetical protein
MGTQQVATGTANFVVQRSACNLLPEAKRRIRLLEDILVGSGIHASDVRLSDVVVSLYGCRRCARLGGKFVVLTRGRHFLPSLTGERHCSANSNENTRAGSCDGCNFSLTSIGKPLAFVEFRCTRLARV